eukprot:gene5874-6115_t
MSAALKAADQGRRAAVKRLAEQEQQELETALQEHAQELANQVAALQHEKAQLLQQLEEASCRQAQGTTRVVPRAAAEQLAEQASSSSAALDQQRMAAEELQGQLLAAEASQQQLQHEIKRAAQDSDKLEEDNLQLQELVSTLQGTLEDTRHKLMEAQQCAAMSTADAKLARQQLDMVQKELHVLGQDVAAALRWLESVHKNLSALLSVLHQFVVSASAGQSGLGAVGIEVDRLPILIKRLETEGKEAGAGGGTGSDRSDQGSASGAAAADDEDGDQTRDAFGARGKLDAALAAVKNGVAEAAEQQQGLHDRAEACAKMLQKCAGVIKYLSEHLSNIQQTPGRVSSSGGGGSLLPSPLPTEAIMRLQEEAAAAEQQGEQVAESDPKQQQPASRTKQMMGQADEEGASEEEASGEEAQEEVQENVHEEAQAEAQQEVQSEDSPAEAQQEVQGGAEEEAREEEQEGLGEIQEGEDAGGQAPCSEGAELEPDTADPGAALSGAQSDQAEAFVDAVCRRNPRFTPRDVVEGLDKLCYHAERLVLEGADPISAVVDSNPNQGYDEYEGEEDDMAGEDGGWSAASVGGGTSTVADLLDDENDGGDELLAGGCAADDACGMRSREVGLSSPADSLSSPGMIFAMSPVGMTPYAAAAGSGGSSSCISAADAGGPAAGGGDVSVAGSADGNSDDACNEFDSSSVSFGSPAKATLQPGLAGSMAAHPLGFKVPKVPKLMTHLVSGSSNGGNPGSSSSSAALQQPHCKLRAAVVPKLKLAGLAGMGSLGGASVGQPFALPPEQSTPGPEAYFTAVAKAAWLPDDQGSAASPSDLGAASPGSAAAAASAGGIGAVDEVQDESGGAGSDVAMTGIQQLTASFSMPAMEKQAAEELAVLGADGEGQRQTVAAAAAAGGDGEGLSVTGSACSASGSRRTAGEEADESDESDDDVTGGFMWQISLLLASGKQMVRAQSLPALLDTTAALREPLTSKGPLAGM